MVKQLYFSFILFYLTVMPLTLNAEGPVIGLSAQMGSGFACVDVKLSLNAKGHPSIYYLALVSGGGYSPDVQMILDYAYGKRTNGLTNGQVVRGHWIASSQYAGRVFSLSGGENIRNIVGEHGFVDGYVYDIFMVAVDDNGIYSNVAEVRDVMAMPFGGMSNGKYIISQGKELANIQNLVERGHKEFLKSGYVLASDIDLRGYVSWKPIENFSGSLDGQGYRIKNMNVYEANGPVGLFANLEGAVIQNLYIEGNIHTEKGPAGGFAGKAVGSIFKDCHSYVDVDGGYQVGGFVGSLLEWAMLVDCYAYGNVYGDWAVGGFIGSAQGEELSENANHSIKISQCGSFGDVVGKSGMAGGFAGSMAYAFADGCQAWSDVTSVGISDGIDTGGFVGRLTHRSRVTRSYAYGDVGRAGLSRGNGPSGGTGPSGGFVGLLTHGSGIEYSFSSGNVVGGNDVGGFAGAIAAPGAPNTIFACISFAPWVVSSCERKGNAGRLVGRMDHNGVNNCFGYLGSVVASAETLRHVQPNPYGPDGGDVNSQTIADILKRIGWEDTEKISRIILNFR